MNLMNRKKNKKQEESMIQENLYSDGKKLGYISFDVLLQVDFK